MNDRCCLCHSGEFALIKSELRDDKLRFKIYQCIACGHVQLLPRPSEEDNKEFYDKNNQDKNREKTIDFEQLRNNNLFDTARHLKLFERRFANRKAKILDIGSGYGFFINALHDSHYEDVVGIEISRERRSMALEHGRARTIDFDLNHPDRDIGAFDVVTLFHVLEHMGDPVEFLKNVLGLIGPGGVLVCEVPNVNEMLLEYCREYNDFYWIRAHLNYFSRETLLRCVKRAGFGDIEILFEQRYGLMNLCNWLSTGKPQIERPIFEIAEAYSSIESSYRDWLKSIGRTDALLAIARKGKEEKRERSGEAEALR